MTSEYQNRDPDLETSGKIIGFYDREFYCLSNFSASQVLWKDVLWLTSEHAYQAARFMDVRPELVESILNTNSPHVAQKIAQANKAFQPPDWDERKISVMKSILEMKLEQCEYVRRKLLQTGGREIVEDSPKDSFWGWGSDRQGRNELGKLWMELREELKVKNFDT